MSDDDPMRVDVQSGERAVAPPAAADAAADLLGCTPADDDLSSEDDAGEDATAAAAAAATAAADASPPVGPSDALAPSPEAAATASAALPIALRGAALQLSEFTPYLHLFPSHRFDPTYLSSPVENRRLSIDDMTDVLSGHPAHHWVMNTPDTRLRWADGDEAMREQEIRDEIREGRRQRAESYHASVAATPAASPPAFSHAALDAAAAAFAATDAPIAAAPSSHANDTSLLDIAYVAVADPNFLQCHKCHKWRAHPDSDFCQIATLPSPFQCDFNTWDARFARCQSAEETYTLGEFWYGMPLHFMRLQSHADFYKRLVSHLQPNGDDAGLGFADSFPAIRRRPVDLFLTYNTVLSLGGYDKVSASNQWRTVQSCLRIPENHDSSAAIKKIYRRLLYDFEKTFWRNPRDAKRTTTDGTMPSQTTVNARAGRSHADTDSLSFDWDGGADHPRSPGSPRRKKRRRSSARPNASHDADTLDEEEMDPTAAAAMTIAAMDDESDADDRTPAGSTSRSATGAIGAFSAALRQLRTSMENRFRALEKRQEDRFARLETNLMRTIRDGFAEMKEAAAAQAQQAKQRHTATARDADRKQELIAKGMNMLISERLRANLPKLAQIKLKSHVAKEEAAKSATPTAAAATHAKNGNNTATPTSTSTPTRIELAPLFSQAATRAVTPAAAMATAATATTAASPTPATAASIATPPLFDRSHTPIGVAMDESKDESGRVSFSVATLVPASTAATETTALTPKEHTDHADDTHMDENEPAAEIIVDTAIKANPWSFRKAWLAAEEPGGESQLLQKDSVIQDAWLSEVRATATRREAAGVIEEKPDLPPAIKNGGPTPEWKQAFVDAIEAIRDADDTTR